jgi:hypothetical protein
MIIFTAHKLNCSWHAGTRYTSQHLLWDTHNYINKINAIFTYKSHHSRKFLFSHLSKDNCLWKEVQKRSITVTIGLLVKIKLQPLLAHNTSQQRVHSINTKTALTLKENKSPWTPGQKAGWTQCWQEKFLRHQELNPVSAVSQHVAQSLYWHKYLATKNE